MKICLSCEGVAATTQERCAHCGVALVPTANVHFPARHGEVDAGNPLLGSVVDETYRIQGVLGRGGMGTVFRAAHAVSLVPVALKLLHPRLSARPEYRRSLLAEARKAGRVVHEHCARVLDVAETGEGTVYLAMELAEGETLDGWVRGRGLAPAHAVSVLEQICRALVAIHAAGLVHRDLSARNVMIAVQGGEPRVKVLDFGIAQSVALAPRPIDGDEGEHAFGNPVFSAPEQLAGLEVDARADLYSLGVIGYLLLAGRLPVRQQAARAAAQDTVAGRLEPLPPLPGVPRRLAALIERCLRLDPAARPPSAAAVLAELQSLRHRGRRLLPAAAMLLAAVAAVVALLTFVRAAPPFLRVPSGRLFVFEGGLLPDTPVQHVHSSDLQSLRAHFGNFAPEQLVLEVTRDQELQKRQRLQPTVDRDGVLVLSTLQAEWRDAVQGIAHASADGPVDIAFVVPGLALLASARLRVDDVPPRVTWSLDGPGGDATLNGSSVVRWEVADEVGVAASSLLLRTDGGIERTFELTGGGGELKLGELLAQDLQRVEPLGPLQLELRAADRAGNAAASPVVRVAAADVAAPAVVEVAGPGGEEIVPFLDDVAQLQVRLAAPEPDLALAVRDPAGHTCADGPLQPPGAGAWSRVELRAGTAAFATGFYTFAVTDPAGNRTAAQFRLAFRNRRLDAGFTARDDGAGRGGVALGELLADPGGATFAFSCNAGFRPTGVLLDALFVPRIAAAPVRVAASRPGGGDVVIGPLAPGAYELQVELEEVGVERPSRTSVRRPLRVLPERIEVRLPDVRGARFLETLKNAGLFAVAGDAVGDGAAVHVDAELRPYLRGTLWVGPEPSRLSPLQLPVAAAGDAEARLFPELRLLPGRNVCALELHDLLGRPATVLLGDEPAPTLGVLQQQAHLLADFHDGRTKPQQVGEELRVEHGRDARLELRTELPFVAADEPAIRLRTAAGELVAQSVRQYDDGDVRIGFVLPVAVWSLAGNLRDLPREQFAAGTAGSLEAQLTTPAGQFTIRLAVRTVRTTLRVLTLGEFGVAELAPALRQLRMIPVLAPADGTFADPVPEDAPGRGLYRAQPAVQVRNVFDMFLQDRELTLAQYAALVAALPLLRGRTDLVHADDPLGASRLEPANMLPAACRGQAAELTALARKAPDAAVAGVDFYQAFTACRVLGLLLVDDPRAFRLPLGCELELAAFGSERPPGTARHGAAAQRRHVLGEPWAGTPAAVPAAAAGATAAGPTAAQCAAAGDLVAGADGAEFTGLDFGLREWVFDLPQGLEPQAQALLREWVADHAQHAARAQRYAQGEAPPVDLHGRLATFGVLRGLPFGERTGLLGADGQPLAPPLARLPPSVPGVVRTEQMRRDGRDLAPGALDPRLWRVGFRVAGGTRFVELARTR